MRRFLSVPSFLFFLPSRFPRPFSTPPSNERALPILELTLNVPGFYSSRRSFRCSLSLLIFCETKTSKRIQSISGYIPPGRSNLLRRLSPSLPPSCFPSTMIPSAAFLLAASSLLHTLATACSHDPLIQRRAVNAARPNWERRAAVDRTTEAGEAAITDAATECSYYSNDAANLVVRLFVPLPSPSFSREGRRAEVD